MISFTLREAWHAGLNVLLVVLAASVAVILFSAFFRSPERKHRGK